MVPRIHSGGDPHLPLTHIRVLQTSWLCRVDKLSIALQVHTNRQNVPSTVSKLAGVIPYPAEEIRTDPPLINMSHKELHKIMNSGVEQLA